MKIVDIYIGTWFQRTNLHLKEFFYFLQTGKSSLPLEKDKLASFYRKLKTQNPRWKEREIFDSVDAKFGEIDMLFFEDGLILFKKDYQNLKNDFKKLQDFYEKSFSSALSYLYSLGAPLPKRLAKTELILPYILVASGASKEEAKELLKKEGDSLQSFVDKPEASLYFGNKIFIFNVKEIQQETFKIEEIIKYFIFFREFASQLNEYLQAHRSIWEDLSKIRSQQSLRFKDFPVIRNSLVEMKQTLSFVEARLAQMENFMDVRRQRAGEKNLEKPLRSLSIYQFDTLKNNHSYITSLWKMTQDYANSTFDLLSMFYQENVQREVDALKLVTIISLMVSFYRLSSITDYNFLDPQFAISVFFIFVFAAIFYFGMRHWFRSRNFELHKKVKKQ